MVVLESSTNRTVIVLGHNRGGTSLIAGMLHSLGVRMGPIGAPSAWIDQQWSTPTGHYENRDFASVNKRILDPTGRWRHLVNPEWVHVRECSPRAREAMRVAIGRNQGPLWGWKNNLTVFLAEEYVRLTPNPHLVFVARAPDAIADALHRREGCSLEEAARSVNLRQQRLDALWAEQNGVPRLLISYEDTVRDPEATVRSLMGFLKIAPDPTQVATAKGLILDRRALRSRVRRLARDKLMESPLRLWKFSCRVVERGRDVHFSSEVDSGIRFEREQDAFGSRVFYLAGRVWVEATSTFRAAL